MNVEPSGRPWRAAVGMFAILAMMAGVAAAGAGNRADDDFRRINALLSEAPPIDAGGEAVERWTRVQAQKLRQWGLKFFCDYPDDLRRWDVIAAMVARRGWWMTSAYEPVDAQARAWLEELKRLQAQLSASAQAGKRSREQVAAAAVREALSYRNHPVYQQGTEAQQAMINSLAERFPDGEQAPALQRSFLQQLSQDRPEKVPAILEQIRNSPHPQIRALARGQLRLIEARHTPVQMRFTALDGREVDLRQLRGKVVVIDFWASWCQPCIKEMPELKRLYEEHHREGLEVIGISLDKAGDRSKLLRLIDNLGLPWPQHFDGRGRDNRYAVQFGVTGIPKALVLDRSGILVSDNLRGNLLAQQIKQLLHE